MSVKPFEQHQTDSYEFLEQDRQIVDYFFDSFWFKVKL